MVNFITSVRRDWHGSLRTRDRLHFEVLKLTEARAEAIKIQCAISSRSGACQLNMSPASGFDYPHIRIESRESASSAGSCKGKQLQMCTVCKRFFLTAEKVDSRVKCPTLASHCLASATTCTGCATCGGVRGCSLWAIDQQSYNDDKGNWLWTRLSVHRIGYKIWRAEQLHRANRGARGHMRATLLRKC